MGPDGRSTSASGQPVLYSSDLRGIAHNEKPQWHSDTDQTVWSTCSALRCACAEGQVHVRRHVPMRITHASFAWPNRHINYNLTLNWP